MFARVSYSPLLLLPAALAAGVILILILWPFDTSEDGSARALRPRGTPNPGLAFAICTQAVELTEKHEWLVGAAEITGKARQHMAYAMELAKGAPEWDRWPSGEGLQIDEGCPALPSLRYEEGEWFDLGKPVEEPGFYNAYIFVVPDENLERLPFGLDPRRADQEHICSGDDCQSEAFALFFGQSQISDEAYVADMFLYSAGIRDLQARQD